MGSVRFSFATLLVIGLTCVSTGVSKDIDPSPSLRKSFQLIIPIQIFEVLDGSLAVETLADGKTGSIKTFGNFNLYGSVTGFHARGAGQEALGAPECALNDYAYNQYNMYGFFETHSAEGVPVGIGFTMDGALIAPASILGYFQNGLANGFLDSRLG